MLNSFYRFEFKYPVPSALIGSIEDDFLKIHFNRDEQGLIKNNFYYVSSLYFDTPKMSDYFDKAGGFLNRKKVRARIYGKNIEDFNKVWLEIKRKYDMLIRKRRIAVTPEEFNLLLSSPHLAYARIKKRLTPEESSFLSEFIFSVASQNRKPYVVVQYQRRALHYFIGSKRIRITFDYNIRAEKKQSFCAEPSVDVSGNTAIIELKFNEKLPAAIKFIMDKYNLRRSAYSKYAMSVDAVRQFYPLGK